MRSRDRVAMPSPLLAAFLLAGANGASSPAAAQSAAELMEIVRRQSQQIEELNRKVEALERRAATPEPPPQPAPARPPTPAPQAAASKPGDPQLKTEWKGPSPTFSYVRPSKSPSEPGKEEELFSFHVRGRLLTGLVWLDDRAGENDSFATQFRAARLGIEGVAWKDFDYVFEVDFAEGDVEVQDAYIQYAGIMEPGFLQAGQFKTPNSLEEQTSNRFTTFMERGAFTDAFDLNRRIGLGGGASGENWQVAAGVFSQNAAETDDFDEGFALAARGSYAVALADKGDWVHLGASTRYRDLGNDTDDRSVRYRQRPFFNINDVRHVDTGDLDDVRSDLFLGAEAALVLGPFSAQAELGYTRANRRSGSDGDLWGGYVDLSWFLTDDRRSYDPEAGEFKRVKVKNPVFDGGWGAWQVAARLDYVDLTDRGAGILGGRQYSAILGVNWYLDDHVRLMLNYAHTEVDGGPADVNEDDGDNSIDGIGMRAQIDF